MAEIVIVKKDNLLFEEGDSADCMYIIKVGEISLHISDLKKEKIVAHASVGELIGEMSLFDRKTRSATAKAVVDSELIRLPYKKLKDELAHMPDWVQVTLRTLSEKIREANTKILTQLD